MVLLRNHYNWDDIKTVGFKYRMVVDGKVEEAIIWHSGHEHCKQDDIETIDIPEDEYIVDAELGWDNICGRIYLITNKGNRYGN